MKRCPVCGEKYSDTYKRCPFCAEEEALRNGELPHRHGGHRVSRKEPSLLSPILIVAILLMAGVLVYLLFGDSIAAKLGMGQAPGTPASSASTSEPAVSSGGAASSGAMPEPEDGDGESGAAGSIDTTGLPETLELSSTDFTADVRETVKLTASGGSGGYTWISEDESVACVDQSGTVTAVSAGTTNVIVTDGSEKGVCIVRVKGTAASASDNLDGGGSPTLSRTDFTLPVGESYTLKVTGTSSSVSWASENSGVAAVSNGTVKGVSGGTTNITATVDGKTLTCIVRVK
jgi:hypothetical protein